MKKIIIISVFLLNIIAYDGFAQNYVQLSGQQIKGRAGQNAQLLSEPVVLTQAAVIVSVSGDNNGFWIVNERGTVQSFFKNNSGTFTPKAIGFRLTPGKYWVYPNLVLNKNKANVTIRLKY